MVDLTKPIGRAPEWVGEDDSRRDISSLSDRAVAVAALDVVLRLSSGLKRHSDEFRIFLKGYDNDRAMIMKDLSAHDRRITALEHANSQIPSVPPMRDPESSWHDWDEALATARAELSRRVKDPKDRLDSIRAREIAQEVVRGVKTADDAQAFRVIKSRGWAVTLEVLKWLVAIVIISCAARCGLHLPG